MFLLRHAKRYREILSVLMRHGLGWLIVELGFGALVPFHWGLLDTPGDMKKLYKAVDRIALSVMLSLFLIASGIFVLVGHFVGYDLLIVRLLLFSIITAGLVTLIVLISVWRQQRF